MRTSYLHTVTLDCPCGMECEVVCRCSGRSSPISYADSREVDVVSVLCEAGCNFDREEYAAIVEEAIAIAYDDMVKMEEGYDW